jgi:uncharacterized membrane protein
MEKQLKHLDSRAVVLSAVTALIAAGSLAASVSANAADMEKCAGIAAAGKNDCGTATSSCKGTAKADRETSKWIEVPKGTCSKIAGGTVSMDPMDKHGGGMAK